ncbi:MAG: sugar lactone lactonase YvrE [Myxococcota bacterium]|jgi:sugar lactone lactonase YvrE
MARWLDLDAPDTLTPLAGGLSQANGIGLSPDEKTLYVLESWTLAVVAFDLQRDGTWSEGWELQSTGLGSFQGRNGNGNLSHIWRKPPKGGEAEIIATLPSGYVPNLRFGSGVGGWERDVLYASDRYDGRIFAIEVVIPGRSHPSK